MRKMKTININGQTYHVDDADAVQYTKQDLTPEQQAQARANIGAAGIDEVGGNSSGLTQPEWGEKTVMGAQVDMPLILSPDKMIYGFDTGWISSGETYGDGIIGCPMSLELYEQMKRSDDFSAHILLWDEAMSTIDTVQLSKDSFSYNVEFGAAVVHNIATDRLEGTGEIWFTAFETEHIVEKIPAKFLKVEESSGGADDYARAIADIAYDGMAIALSDTGETCDYEGTGVIFHKVSNEVPNRPMFKNGAITLWNNMESALQGKSQNIFHAEAGIYGVCGKESSYWSLDLSELPVVLVDENGAYFSSAGIWAIWDEEGGYPCPKEIRPYAHKDWQPYGVCTGCLSGSKKGQPIGELGSNYILKCENCRE